MYTYDYWRFTSTSADRVYIFHYQKRCYHVNSKVKLKNQDSRKLHLHQKRQVKRLFRCGFKMLYSTIILCTLNRLVIVCRNCY